MFTKEKEYPKTWKSLEYIEGYFVDEYGCSREAFNTQVCKRGIPSSNNKNVFVTDEQTKASIALAQLTQLLKAYNSDWKPDYDNGEHKYFIKLCYASFVFSVERCTQNPHLLVFKDRNIADMFRINFTNLIKRASPLLFGYTFKD
jgi:hypothetical protein